MRILLTGKTGQIGRELSVLLPRFGEVYAPNRQQLDLTKPAEIRGIVREIRPGLIVNAAAYTAVDQAESEKATAEAINEDAPRFLAEEGKAIGACLVHYSTDYVFDGKKAAPYLEDDPPNPQTVYGRTKLAGEQRIRDCGIPHLIFRIAWIYGREGRNFLLTILKQAAVKEELKVVCDQTGSPTWSREVAQATTQILSQIYALKRSDSFSGVSGTYHMSAGGETTWYDFTKAILEETRSRTTSSPWLAAATGRQPLIAQHVIPIRTAEYPQAAHRPTYSVLSNARLTRTFCIEMPHWRTQLSTLFSEDSQKESVEV